MNCAKCGLDLPPGARQCPKCGTVNEFKTPEAPKKVKPVVWLVAALALVAVAAVVFASVMASRAKQNVTQAPGGNLPPGNVVTAPPGQPAPGNIVSAPPGSPAPSAGNPAGVAKPKPPQAVVDYLDFVKKVEEHRQELLRDTGDALTISAAGGQAQSLINMIDIASDPDNKEDLDPLKDAKDELMRQYKNWVSTIGYFDKKTAPNECREFSGAYRDVLYREAKAIGEIATGLSKVNVMDPKDMSKLLSEMQKMKRDPSIQRNIDASADNADGKLKQLVSQYDMPKPFDIPREQQAGGSIMGF
jgi:hypothetical protein